MSPKCLISCIAHNPTTSVALSEISPCKMTVTVGLVKSSSALLTSSLTKCPVFVDRIRHFLHLEILHRQKQTTLSMEQSKLRVHFPVALSSPMLTFPYLTANCEHGVCPKRWHFG